MEGGGGSPARVSGHPLDGDLTIPANIPLPPGTDSPLKGRSVSPDRGSVGGGERRRGRICIIVCFAYFS